MRNSKPTLSLALVLLTLLLALPVACHAEVSVLDAYDDPSMVIGVPTGATAMGAAEERFPNAKILYYSADMDGYVAVASGKVDAYAHDFTLLKYACEENSSLKLLSETFGKTDISVGIASRRPDLIEPVNAFLRELIDSGVRDDMLKRWTLDAEGATAEIEAPSEAKQTIRVGTSGTVTPMTFYGANGELTGFDIELMRRLAVDMDAKLEISVMNYDALVAGLESGKLDLVIANLNITPERAERISYSIPYMTAATGLVVKNDAPAADSGFATVADLQAYFHAGTRIGVQAGTIFDAISKKYFPDAEIVYVNSGADLINSINTDKIDGYLVDKPQGYAQCLVDNTIWMPDVAIEDDNYGVAMSFAREALCADVNETLASLRASGELDAIAEKWFLTDEAQKPMPGYELTGENGKLTLITSADAYPFSYVRDDGVVGYEIELFMRVCYEHGYSLEIDVADFTGVLAAISTGKADAAVCCISITEERKSQMLFSDPTYEGGMMAILPISTHPASSQAGVQSAQGVSGLKAAWSSICASFERTFIRENRWMLIAQGLWTTIVISVLSALFGTFFGFVVCLARRSRIRVVNALAKTFIQIMQGTPIVVFLMILYYIVFGDVEPVLVAVVGFALNFAAYVSEMMRTGIDAVDKGQLEAASAIGFTRTRVFLLITLPQAARHFLPVFKGEFISLVKMTSVVGYITIQDLTKMSDIIRSRTYEAFFPLIATAIIYFLLAWALTLALTAIEARIDPQRKVRAVKGVREETREEAAVK